jgi:hypothetical protein
MDSAAWNYPQDVAQAGSGFGFSSALLLNNQRGRTSWFQSSTLNVDLSNLSVPLGGTAPCVTFPDFPLPLLSLFISGAQAPLFNWGKMPSAKLEGNR